MEADINGVFEDMAKKTSIGKKEILECQFGVYEALEWDSYAGQIVEKMISLGYEVDGNMRCYLPSNIEGTQPTA